MDAYNRSKHYCDEKYFIEETLLGGTCEMLVHEVLFPSFELIEYMSPNPLDLILLLLVIHRPFFP